MPLPIALLGKNLEENMDRLWNNFDKDNRVGLVGREIDSDSGRFHFATFRLARTKADVQASKTQG